jgi:long-chain acyl-CoA synthetase
MTHAPEDPDEANAALAAECLAATDELTLPRLIRRNAEAFGDRPALTVGDRTVTWRQLRDDAAAMARALAALGLARGERMMIMMSSRIEHWVVDLAATHLAAIPCTVYRTSSAEQVEFLARHSRASVVVLEDAGDVERWRIALASVPEVRRVIVLDAAAIPPSDPRCVAWDDALARGRRLHAEDPAVFEAAWQAIAPDDPLALMYTSGTTGDPKGVMLSHRNAFYEAVAVDRMVPVAMHSASIAYLPLAHIAERELGIYRAAYKALHVTVCPDPAAVVPALCQVRPPAFFGVPRVWEKLAAGLRAKLATLPEARSAPIAAAHAVAADAFRRRGRGEPVPAELAERVAAAERDVLRPLRATMGLDALTWASSGSAPIPVEVLEYLGGFGIAVLEVWGMSETTGCATLSTLDGFRLGAVGRPLPGVELRLADDGEMFVRGPIVFLGYLGADGEIARATDADGWLATGDVGTVDGDGYWRITDRKKELIITSSGKNIAPSAIEGLLRAHPLVGHAIAIGDRRPYVTALIALDPEAAPGWARAAGIDAHDLASLAADPRVRAELDGLVAAVNARLSRPEQIRRFTVVSEPWLPGSELITLTMKLRRRAVLAHYAAEIDALYA